MDDGRRTLVDLTGQPIGPYLAEERLGRGIVCETYRGRNTLTQQPVVIKRIPAGAGVDLARAVESPLFSLRVHILCALAHCCISDVIEWLPHDGAAILVEEYLGGETARALLDRGETFTPEVWRNVAGQVLLALEYAHQRNLLHLDLRPENIFFLDRQHSLKVSGFGTLLLAAQLDPERFSHGFRTGYTAPEVLEGQQPSVRSDIYSFGAAMYELAIGRAFAPLSQATTETGERFAHLEVSQPSAPAARADPRQALQRVLPLEAAEVVFRCLETDPAQRFEMVRNVRQALGFLPARVAEWAGTETRPYATEVLAAPATAQRPRVRVRVPPTPAAPTAPKGLPPAAPAMAGGLRFCPECGRPIPPNSTLCTVCGHTGDLAQAAPPAAPATAAPQPVQTGPPVAEPTSWFHQQAFRLMREGRFEESRKAYEMAVQREPNNARAWREYGDVLCVCRDYKNAERAYRRAVELDPKDLSLRNDLARVLIARNDPREAMPHLELIIKSSGDSALQLSAQLNMAAAYLRMNQPESALGQVCSVLEQNPNNIPAHLLLASTYAQMRLYDQAIQELETVLARDPANSEAQLAIGRIVAQRESEQRRVYREPWGGWGGPTWGMGGGGWMAFGLGALLGSLFDRD